MLTVWQRFIKRSFDVSISILLLVVLVVPLCVLVVMASIDTKEFGFFSQLRIGYRGNSFYLFKIRTISGNRMYSLKEAQGRLSSFGAWLKNSKINELPQLFNVLIGDMSMVGPRPDLPGYADLLEGEDRIILTIRPGITGPATLKYKNEEAILRNAQNPEHYNDTIIWPDKVSINKQYVKEWSFWKDMGYLWRTMFG